MRSAYSASQRTTLPIPAATLWSSSSSPMARAGAERSRARRTASCDLRIPVEEVGPERAQGGVEGEPRAVEQLEHRAAELDRAQPAGAEHEPRGRLAAAPALTCAVDVPGARHAQVGVEAASVVELQQQVLAARAHGREDVAIERGCETGRRPRRG